MIRGRRIKLRAVEKSDLETLWRWENDEEVMEFASSSPERCVSKETIARIFEGGPSCADGGTRRYIVLDENDEAIGLASYWLPNPRFAQSAEIGIYIGEKARWHQGYGSDAVMTLALILFRHLGMQRVGFTTGSHNIRMQKLLEKLGVTLEGVIRKERFMHGRYYDTLRLGMLREEFDEIYRRWQVAAERAATIMEVPALERVLDPA